MDQWSEDRSLVELTKVPEIKQVVDIYQSVEEASRIHRFWKVK